jgi:uncharacterized protein (TIGR03083 family)
MTDAYDANWLSGDTYDLHRASDFDLFVTAAHKDPSAHVPTCPDWDVAGLCDHLARVYQGRTHAIVHASFLERDQFETRSDEVDPITWVQRWYVELDRALRGRADDATTVTFMPGVTTVRFWRRRMALETLVHRTDAEIAVGQVSPMDDALSADGVDELLWFNEGPSERTPGDDAMGDGESDGNSTTSVVELTDGARAWRISVSESSIDVGTSASPDATVRGSAPALLLALSGRDLHGIGEGRFGVAPLVLEGDRSAYERLRARFGGF